MKLDMAGRLRLQHLIKDVVEDCKNEYWWSVKSSSRKLQGALFILGRTESNLRKWAYKKSQESIRKDR